MQAATEDLKTETDFRRWLQRQLMERTRKNPRYSLRAFAQYLEMDASSVSQIISGKRRASTKVIKAICDKLAPHPQQRAAFLQKKSASIVAEAASEQLLAQDAFAVISDWYHYAILELTYVDGFQCKPNWISRSLGISASDAQVAVERLLRLGLLRTEERRVVRTNGVITNIAPGVTSAGHKSFQRQVVSKALDAIDNCPQEDKDITSITMAADPRKLPEARKKIAKFRRELSNFLEDGSQERVYNFALQLYPISKSLNEPKDKK